MWVVDNNKDRVKTYLRSDVESSITSLCDASNQLHDTISAINRATSGSFIGADRQIIEECQKALKELSESIQDLYECRTYIDLLDVMMWVPDND